MNKPLVINFIAGPSAGKSTQAALLFAKLKIMGIKVELVTEYPKDKVWEESFKVLENQLYLFAKQQHRTWRVANKVDVIVTDSPLLQYLAYSNHMSDAYKMMVVEEANKYQNVNIFLDRGENPFQQEGRIHGLNEAKQIDVDLIDLIERYQTIDLHLLVNESTVDIIVDYLLSKSFI